ncbi:ABC transporter ATP-binding protein [Yinghuangia soli]|uniref:ABC transporter ATP-binding protein n=1 Tax=Yinghuangia soli TaxID=2908204 RepID=A0AA41U1G4_9ACTN|nr:ABC transporter ATP-binding protein [Yinghuangia soli]MCF2529515.1 ABC transporter ATP-binding protein [Yinghuangia soli]
MNRAAARPLVEFEGVERVFEADPPVHALRAVTLRIDEGEHVAVTGPSGSGKSTLLGLLGLLDRPTAGAYRFGGVETTALAERDRAALRAGSLGFVFQAFHLLPYRTVEENVMLAEVYRPRGTAAPPRRTRKARAAQALDRVGLGHRAGFRPDRLSGGERQRVAIARALLGEPALLLCDEPTGNLDGDNTAVVLDVLDELHADGLTLLVITHDEAVAARAARRIRIADGRVVGARTAQGATEGAVEGAVTGADEGREPAS